MPLLHLSALRKYKPVGNHSRRAESPGKYPPELLTSCLPTQLWIELTNTCPLNCIFCSRKGRFGTGQHLDFALFLKLISQLKNPEMIRLNYSGESILYPQLLPAIELAASTGAATELVTALIPGKEECLLALMDSPLNRLSLSIHTLDPDQFPILYGGGTLAQWLDRLQLLLGRRRTRGGGPTLDFCLVAMTRNLPQLAKLASLAEENDISEINVHPVIQRHRSPGDFQQEWQGHSYSSSFLSTLFAEAERLGQKHPGLHIEIIHPQFHGHSSRSPEGVTSSDSCFGGNGPPWCEQNPWETLHCLANGEIVVCETLDQTPMGNLAQEDLIAIWQGEKYRHFRRNYATGAEEACSRCPQRIRPNPEAQTFSSEADHDPGVEFIKGWYELESSGIRWSKPEALVRILGIPQDAVLKLQGILPPAAPQATNRLLLFMDGKFWRCIENSSGQNKSFEAIWPLPGESKTPNRVLSFNTETAFRPWLAGNSLDIRCLGFALQALAVVKRSAVSS